MTDLLAHVEGIWQAVVPRLPGFTVEVLPEIDSTNTELMRRARAGLDEPVLLVAEQQTAGRGRLGKGWHSKAEQSLTFSIALPLAPADWSGLSLAVGVSLAESLHPDVRLKWPNDLWLQQRKLGGILVELLPGVPHAAVIGIGVNLRLPPEMPDDLRATSAALDSPDAEENGLYAVLLAELLAILERFGASGFAPLSSDWLARHAFQNASVLLASDFGAPRHGICRGVDADGALLFEAGGRVERVLSGEVSLRPA